MAQPGITMTAGAAATPPNNTVVETIRTTASGTPHIQSVLGGSIRIQSKAWRFTASQVNNTLVTVAATERIVVTAASVTISSTSVGGPIVLLRLATGTVTATGTGSISSAGVAGVVCCHPGVAQGGGMSEGSGAGMLGVGAANEDLKFACTNPTGTVYVRATYLVVDA